MAKVRGHAKSLCISVSLKFYHPQLLQLHPDQPNQNLLSFILLHRSLDTFCPTTGMFPQEFIITFSALMSIGNIKFLSSNGEDDCG